MIIRDLAEWAAPWNNFNYPINVYPAGSYGYSVSAPAEGEGGTHDGETPVTVKYPAGLGTSVSANFKGTIDNNPLLSVIMANCSGDTLRFGTSNTKNPLLKVLLVLTLMLCLIML